MYFIFTFPYSDRRDYDQTILFLRDERHKQAGEVPAERSRVSSTQETQISGKIGKSKSEIRSRSKSRSVLGHKADRIKSRQVPCLTPGVVGT